MSQGVIDMVDGEGLRRMTPWAPKNCSTGDRWLLRRRPPLSSCCSLAAHCRHSVDSGVRRLIGRDGKR
jgi:hypothetical protein